jgi:cytochrome b
MRGKSASGKPGMSGIKLPMRVWDAPVRLFHWGIVLLIASSYITIELGWIHLHLWAGFTMLAALLFRIVWGFVGSDTARFSQFLRSPLAGLRYLSHMFRREEDTEIGHNAAGGWMVLLLILLLVAQVATGLCSNTDEDFMVNGPLAKYVGKHWSDRLSAWHSFNFYWLILTAIVLHLLAITAYALLKGQNLIRPMITGKKRMPGAMRPPRMASPLRAIVVFAGSVAIAVAVATLL